ncbi:MAG: thioredoxin [Rhodospirillaceae bacterium]|nr:thioredoxin [Rhodospirillaceae bacterium]
MLIGQAGAVPADLIKDTTTDSFMADVMEASKTTPVIVDFWAPWCGPCKQLGPLLEKLVKQYGGKVKLVKINVDENQELAMQFRVQSIPAVYGFKDGRPVDGFMGALPENQLKQFIERLTGGGGSPIDEALSEAEAMLAAGEKDDALALYQEVLDQDPANVKALAGVMRTYLALGQEQAARDLLAKLPEQAKNATEIASVRATLELQDQAANSNAAQIQGLEAKVAADPKDMQSRLDLAMARFGAGDKQQAIDDLLEMVRKDRKWNEEAARKQLVKFFEAFGPADPLTREGRRKLSAILFS